MSNHPVGMAIQITEDNAENIAILNRGVAPKTEDFYTGTYFIFPYAPDAAPRIVPGYVFDANWAFTERPDPTYFVEIVEI